MKCHKLQYFIVKTFYRVLLLLFQITVHLWKPVLPGYYCYFYRIGENSVHVSTPALSLPLIREMSGLAYHRVSGPASPRSEVTCPLEAR